MNMITQTFVACGGAKVHQLYVVMNAWLSASSSIREAARSWRVRGFESSRHDLAMAVAAESPSNRFSGSLLHNTESHDAIPCVSA
jgi:hypothetical protein